MKKFCLCLVALMFCFLLTGCEIADVIGAFDILNNRTDPNQTEINGEAPEKTPKDPSDKASSSGWFFSDENPALSDEGIKGVITEAYYTNNGSLALLLTLSNGLNANHYLTELSITVENENGEVIAEGYTDAIPENYHIKPYGYNTFLLYIQPEHVKIKNDDLNSLAYEISTVGEIEREAVNNAAK